MWISDCHSVRHRISINVLSTHRSFVSLHLSSVFPCSCILARCLYTDWSQVSCKDLSRSSEKVCMTYECLKTCPWAHYCISYQNLIAFTLHSPSVVLCVVKCRSKREQIDNHPVFVVLLQLFTYYFLPPQSVNHYVENVPVTKILVRFKPAEESEKLCTVKKKKTLLQTRFLSVWQIKNISVKILWWFHFLYIYNDVTLYLTGCIIVLFLSSNVIIKLQLHLWIEFYASLNSHNQACCLLC